MISPSKVALQSLTESKQEKGIVNTVMIITKIRLLQQICFLKSYSFSLPTNKYLETNLNYDLQL